MASIVNINPSAQLQPSGLLPNAPMASDPALPYAVILELDDDSVDLLDIPGGAVGTPAIYRFARPVCYPGFPPGALPDALPDAPPLGVKQLVDGVLQ